MAYLVITLAGEDDEVSFVRRTFYLGRRYRDFVRAHFGEDVLFVRTGECFGTGHFSALEETADGLRMDVSNIEEFRRSLPAPFDVAAPVGEVSETDFEHILTAGRTDREGLTEDYRIPYRPPPRTSLEIAVIAAYDARCALTAYRARTQAAALGRLEVVYLTPLDLGGAPDVTNAIPVDMAIAYAVKRGHIVFSDEYEIEVRVPLPVKLRHPFNPTGKLTLPARPEDWPSLEAIRYHRRLANPA